MVTKRKSHRRTVRRASLWPAAALVAAVIAAISSPLAAANRFYVSIETLLVGSDQQEVVVRFDNDVTVIAFSVDINFDPAVVRVDRIDGANDALSVRSTFNNTDGTIGFHALPLEIPPDANTSPGAGHELLTVTVTVLTTTPAETRFSFSTEPRRSVMTTSNFESIVPPDLEVDDGVISLVDCAAPLPTAPSDLRATASAASVVLAWTDNAIDETGYAVERRDPGTSTFREIATLDADVKSYTDGSVDPDLAYDYRVRAVNSGASADCRYSDYAGPITVKPPGPSSAFAQIVQLNDRLLNVASGGQSQRRWFAFDAITGTAIKLKVRATGANPSLDVRLFDAFGTPMPLEGATNSGRRFRLKNLPIPATGMYFLMVGAAGDTPVSFDVAVRGALPKELTRLKDELLLKGEQSSFDVTFDAFPATIDAIVKASGPSVDPDILDLVTPSGNSILPTDPRLLIRKPHVEKIRRLAVSEVGTYTLRIAGEKESLGEAALRTTVKIRTPRKRSITEPEALPILPVPFAIPE